MEYTTLGKTGLRVSRLGLGCGGHSRLGLALGNSSADAERLVREALILGVNFIDTAESYGTEEMVGRGIQSVPRGEIVISTKAGVNLKDRRCTGAEYKARVEASLKRLQTDYVDIFHIHGVSAEEYPYAVSELVPAIEELQHEGKIRYIGITETFGKDPAHTMLGPAVRNSIWDVVMVGFNIINQSARLRVLDETQKQNVGVLCMFALRRALSRADALRELMDDLISRGLVDPTGLDRNDPLSFLMRDGGAESTPDTAYRFCRYESGLDVILSGTSSIDHLRENAASLERPSLNADVVRRLISLFSKVDCESGN